MLGSAWQRRRRADRLARGARRSRSPGEATAATSSARPPPTTSHSAGLNKRSAAIVSPENVAVGQDESEVRNHERYEGEYPCIGFGQSAEHGHDFAVCLQRAPGGVFVPDGRAQRC